MGSQSYNDLIVWQKSIDLCVDVYRACSGFPKSEMYGLSDQMKRAAVSVPSNIAEGQARQSLGEFCYFLSIAKGSLAELDTQRIIAERLGILSGDESAGLGQRILELRKMLYALVIKLKSEGREAR
jgi:four helix bundle protein